MQGLLSALSSCSVEVLAVVLSRVVLQLTACRGRGFDVGGDAQLRNFDLLVSLFV